MANEIMVPAGGLPAYLQPTQAQADEFGAGISQGQLLPVLSIRGKDFRVRWNGQEQNLRTRELEVIFVASRPNISKRWYGKQYESGSIEAPDCYSTRGDKADPSVTQPQGAACASCPKNQFGSKITASGKQGKACADYKRIVVLPLIDGKAIDTPCVLDVPAMSLRKTKGHQGNDLFLAEYLTALHKHGLPATGAVTVLGFSDAEYPQVNFGYSRLITEAEHGLVTQLRESEEVQNALDMAQAESTGPIIATDTPVLAPTAAAPTPVAAPTPAPAAEPDPMADVESFLKSATAPEAPPARQPARAETQPSLFEQPAPQPSAPEPVEAGDDDVMAEVSALLGGLK